MLKMHSDHLSKNAMANSKDVVVTGVSTGIGWGTTKVLVSKGFRVFGSVRKQADADSIAKRVRGRLRASHDGHYGRHHPPE
jgi:NAD(P)-dependent dehydrogenase (short-subunit alcohol dehydrogenase family)